MDAPDLPPLPPLPFGDPAGPPADADALRGVLRHHRRRQVTSGSLVLAVVLAAGAAGGFAVGHSGTTTSHGTQVASASNAANSADASGASPAISPSGGGSTGMVAGTAGGGSTGASSGGVTIPLVAPTSTQLLLRNASDGTRVRLYEQDLTTRKVACPSGAPCPQVAPPVCAPASFVTAEVSDDQVAGETGGPVWSTAPTVALEVAALGVVGAGQPQPILVVVAQVQPSVAKVTLTTPYGADEQAPIGGWVALAVRLPADFAKSETSGLGTSTLAAADSSGKALVSQPLSGAPRSAGPTCRPCLAMGASAPADRQAGVPGTPQANGPATGAVVATGPAPYPCPFPCPPVGSASKGPAPNMRMCVAPPRDASSTTVAPPAGAQGGGGPASSPTP